MKALVSLSMYCSFGCPTSDCLVGSFMINMILTQHNSNDVYGEERGQKYVFSSLYSHW